MCGIFGYVGKDNNVGNLILEGLKTLEYRGYDSWGIAVKNGKTIEIEKKVGKIGDPKLRFPKSSIGIGHTRWATHGGVTVENAHPHLDCSRKIAVLHNGIIENFEELKKELLEQGHKFVSETDTEVMPHLIEEGLKKEGFASSVRDAFNRLKGLNAIVALNADSSEIIAAKTGSPLVIGVSDDGYYISSDSLGLVPHTRNLLFLEDNEMVILGKTLKLISLPRGEEKTPDIQTVDWKFEKVDKGKYKHFLLKEINEQPQVVENIALNYETEVKNLADLIDEAFGTFLLGCGTASYSGLAGTYLFSKIAKKHVNFSIGSEFNYLEDYLTPKSLVIPISQSGETIDVVEPVARAKQKGSRIAAITNVLGSTLYRQSDFKILLGAGPEKAVVGTKSFTAMVAVLLFTAYTLAKRQAEGKKMLSLAAENVSEILKNHVGENIQKLAATLKNREHIYVIGRGISYATALEATLKIKETACLHAEGFAGGELKHGVIALIEKGTPCIVIAPNDETYDDIISNAQEVKARGGIIIGIGPRPNKVFDHFLQTADVAEATIIPQVVVAQLLAYYLALARGIEDPDKPRNLAKSVTVK
ncbi:MAG: glutamine--fructose-6-phosphate aminotransferase [Candidatus Levybacteria bacterium RIFOXYA1_FULL_41_10]|nr:MAG: Glucosamine/fructose-6-phosphate aminotransferase, isomerizing [Candidatus Levybacteria bacterium GW2011_GWA1_39_34]KKR51647.1 MAG: Glucosamine/fructose-6-phosphate aminotransferase, isomerizing [Candidatus Levybacteria bacterium GW2011_GWC1_40_19]KKR71415.1 MAG: Glucosamine/fructose-6-phosphate aminotransferase, isomerizing [Candidatus Levybacteria bacterium GW2011_GWC2_40_7]KKR95497.1 MAG: Glucosamine/fructose-6-phosphate aminotransferase, isomerizing [Candidatus Levybacteria bacterium